MYQGSDAEHQLIHLIVANPSKFTQKMTEYYVNEMIKEDVVFVTASGNDDREEVAVCMALVLFAGSIIN